MANILVYIETDGDAPAPASLEALGEGRRLATRMGASLYGFALVDHADNAYGRYGHDALVRTLGEAGADKVALRLHVGPRAPAQWRVEGEALCELCRMTRPSLVLFAATRAGRMLAPRTAARLGAAFAAESTIERDGDSFALTRAVFGHRARRRLAGTRRTPIVVTLTPGRFARATGWDEAETQLVDSEDDVEDTLPRDVDSRDALEREPPPVFAVVDAEPAARPPFEAPVIVVAGDAVTTPEQLALVTALADALGGELAATRAVCDRGLVDRERQVGVDTLAIAPRLYVVCGATGSEEHLAAVPDGTSIVAIGDDPGAAAMRAADHALVGAIDQAVPALIDAIRARRPGGAT